MTIADTRYERLPPGTYTLRYNPKSGDFDRAGLRLDGPAGLWWTVSVVAHDQLLGLLDEHYSDPVTNARLKAVLVEAAVPIVREMVEQEKLPSSTEVWIAFDDRHYGLAFAVDSDRPLTVPGDYEIVLTVERSPRPGPRRSSRPNRPRGWRRQRRAR